MNKERLQEIKDSVNFQREILKAHNMETLCIDEEQELIEEIERLNKDLGEMIKSFAKEREKTKRLNNIIKEALEKSKGLQYRFGYVLDDLVYLLMQGSDKE